MNAKLRVLEILEQKGKSRYWLNKQLGMSWRCFTAMISGETTSIKYEIVEALCQILDCTIDDLFEITEEKPENK